MASLVAPGSLAVSPTAPAGAGRPGHGPTPGGRDATVAAILVISPASCRGRPHQRASALARAMLARIRLITH